MIKFFDLQKINATYQEQFQEKMKLNKIKMELAFNAMIGSFAQNHYQSL
jgi:hypothetical protein